MEPESSPQGAQAAEVRRIEAAYAARDASSAASPYRYANPGYALYMQLLESSLLRSLQRAPVALEGSSVLDVGCGSGYFLNRLSEFGAGTATGVDLIPERVDAARRRYPALRIRMRERRRAAVRRWRVRHRDPVHLPVVRARSGLARRDRRRDVARDARRRDRALLRHAAAPGTCPRDATAGRMAARGTRPRQRRHDPDHWRSRLPSLRACFRLGRFDTRAWDLAFGLCTVAARSPLCGTAARTIPVAARARNRRRRKTTRQCRLGTRRSCAAPAAGQPTPDRLRRRRQRPVAVPDRKRCRSSAGSVTTVTARPNPTANEASTDPRHAQARVASGPGHERRRRPRSSRVSATLACSPRPLPPTSLWAVTGRPAIRHALAGDSPAVVWATAPPQSAILAAVPLARRAGIPVVAELRDLWAGNPFFDAGGRLLSTIEARSLRDADAVVTVTPACRETLLKLHPELDASVRLLPNGFDPALLTLRDGPRRRSRPIGSPDRSRHPDSRRRPVRRSVGRPPRARALAAGASRTRVALELLGTIDPATRQAIARGAGRSSRSGWHRPVGWDEAVAAGAASRRQRRDQQPRHGWLHGDAEQAVRSTGARSTGAGADPARKRHRPFPSRAGAGSRSREPRRRGRRSRQR